jgi:hypothetical protein
MIYGFGGAPSQINLNRLRRKGFRSFAGISSIECEEEKCDSINTGKMSAIVRQAESNSTSASCGV